MITLYSNLPQLDLHGETCEIAKIRIREFIEDQYKMKNEKIIIIHGIGTGKLKKTTQETLKTIKYVEKFKLDNFNAGQTIVKLYKNN